MADSGKRKAIHGADGDGSLKKKKKGNSGKWKVTRSEDSDKPKGNTIEPGDVGIWVTCPLHMKGKAAREMELLFDEYADKLYGIKTEDEPANGSEDEGDIEAAIQKELGSLKDKKNQSSDDKGVFREVRINQECLLFMKCKAPVEPVEFSRRICQDAVTGSHGARARYLNRLTPVTVITKASENGIEEATRKALAGHLKLQPKEAATDSDSVEKGGKTEGDEETSQPFTFAIRPSIRNHNTLQRDDVIKRIATLVDPQHKVNLGAPDKVILVDIYQTICGMSVVPGDWDTLKKYNLTELYKQANLGKTEPEDNNGKTELQSNKSKPTTESNDASCSS